jgi:hypothetical protein
MFTAKQYRAKAAEFRAFLTNTPRSPNQTSEFRDLEQTYTTLAENEEWMALHIDKTIQRRKKSEDCTALAEEEEQILKCLGAAVLMRWNTIPTKLQRELFDCASTIGDLQPATSLKGQIARFLHNHKDDQQNRMRRRGGRACEGQDFCGTLDEQSSVEKVRFIGVERPVQDALEMTRSTRSRREQRRTWNAASMSA